MGYYRSGLPDLFFQSQKVHSINAREIIIMGTLIVGGSSKIQTLCHMTQVLLKLRFTAMERLSGY